MVALAGREKTGSPRSESRAFIWFLRSRPEAQRWKYLVFSSPSLMFFYLSALAPVGSFFIDCSAQTIFSKAAKASF
jgi:hypothetical protein